MITDAKQVVETPVAAGAVKPHITPAPRTAPNSIKTSTPTITKPAPTPASSAPATAATKLKVYRFAKLWGIAELITFRDKTTFKFRQIKRNDTPGYSPTSSVETTDEKLAENLREAAKTNASIREAPAK